MLTYDSGADGHYLSKEDRKKLGLPILRLSAKKAGVENGGACNGKYVTKMPFPKLSNRAAEVETFEEFPTSLMSVGKTADNGNVSIFTKKRRHNIQIRGCLDYMPKKSHSHRKTR